MIHQTPNTGSLIDEQEAHWLASIALVEAGVPEDDADQVAAALVDTSLRGIDTHGLRLLPQYLDELATGVANAAACPTVVRDRGAGLLLDADGALGVLAGLAAARLAADRAKAFGVVLGHSDLDECDRGEPAGLLLVDQRTRVRCLVDHEVLQCMKTWGPMPGMSNSGPRIRKPCLT